MTHLSLRDNESESPSKVSECESLNSETKMGPALLERSAQGMAMWRCVTFKAERGDSFS